MSRKLVKSKNNKIISGVLGGVGEYLGVEPTVVRIVWLIVLAFTGFVPGIALYTVAALVLPGSGHRK